MKQQIYNILHNYLQLYEKNENMKKQIGEDFIQSVNNYNFQDGLN